MVTVGNFFSGSGTWELAAELCGATPIWESEIEPFPVALEHKRFPNCKQLGDITKVSGYAIEPCDIMTNSSPCQDISVAGLRRSMEKGSGTRSSLFHEVIRITKEMREHELEQIRRVRGADDDIRFPRPYLWCWENVTGALSSNKGEDFRQVLEEIAKIVQADVHIPMPDNGKWANAGFVDGDGYSIAWCIRNAVIEGVPQRRRRIFLVADFRGRSATEILFKRPSVSWNFETIRETWETPTRSLEERIDEARRYIRTGDKLLEKQNAASHSPAYGIDRYAWNQGENAQFDFSILENIEPSLVARGGAAVAVPRNLKNGICIRTK